MIVDTACKILPSFPAPKLPTYPRIQVAPSNDGRIFEREMHTAIHSVYRIDRKVVSKSYFYSELYGPQDGIT